MTEWVLLLFFSWRAQLGADMLTHPVPVARFLTQADCDLAGEQWGEVERARHFCLEVPATPIRPDEVPDGH